MLINYVILYRLIRLEFNSEGCDYYTELDAVELVGKLPSGNLHTYIITV